MGRPKGGKNHKNDTLEAFAKRIERQVIEAGIKDCETMERLICRILTKPEKNPAVAAMLAGKWAEWRYGKAKETHEHSVKVEMNLGDADRIIAGYFIAAGRGANQASEGDSGQAKKQSINVLPA